MFKGREEVQEHASFGVEEKESRGMPQGSLKETRGDPEKELRRGGALIFLFRKGGKA